MAKGLSKFFESPRRRKRAIVLALVVAAAATVALLLTYERNTAPSQETKMTNKKAAVAPSNPKAVPFTKAESRAVLDVARNFIDAGVAGHHFKRSWDLTTPAIHSGIAKKDWGPDNSTITPFRYQYVRWRLDHSFPNEVGFEVALYPKEHDKDYPSPMVFDTVVTHTGSAKAGKWRVSYWAPAPGQAQVVQSNTRSSQPSLAKVGGGPSQLSSMWLAVPIGIFALILLIPITIGVRDWRRGRRARREYEATLPSLSNYTSSSKPS